MRRSKLAMTMEQSTTKIAPPKNGSAGTLGQSRRTQASLSVSDSKGPIVGLTADPEQLDGIFPRTEREDGADETLGDEECMARSSTAKD